MEISIFYWRGYNVILALQHVLFKSSNCHNKLPGYKTNCKWYLLKIWCTSTFRFQFCSPEHASSSTYRMTLQTQLSETDSVVCCCSLSSCFHVHLSVRVTCDAFFRFLCNCVKIAWSVLMFSKMWNIKVAEEEIVLWVETGNFKLGMLF